MNNLLIMNNELLKIDIDNAELKEFDEKYATRKQKCIREHSKSPLERHYA